jgi:16S rRNA U1498 N3-methylase RsmE
VVVFDKGGTLLSSSLGTSLDLHWPFVGVVGPEWGLTAKDYENFPLAEVVGLGETVLRMETAAIVGGRRLRNLW